MKRFIYTCVIWLCAIQVNARDIKYPVAAIPDAIKQNVNIVIREDETIFKINSRKSSTLHIHMVVTIFNSNGKDYATTVIYYDKMRKVKDLNAAVYNAAGESIKKLKSSEIVDRAASGGDALFSDDRYKAFDLEQSQYPYTVDVEYDLEFDYLYFIPGSSLSSREDVAVQHFKYQLIYPLDLKPRYRLTNIDLQPIVASAGSGIESLTWSFDNVQAIKREPMAPVSKYVRKIDAAPNGFEIGGYSGNMSSWQEFGKWFIKVNEGRDKLPEETKHKVHELTDGLKTKEEKTRAIYEYMQSRTRYVGIQLGIGGLQPFEATTVDETGYGDCKALSNYMVAMLKEAGIRAHYTMIYAGDRNYGIDPSFPSSHSNHIIVAVPNESDTTWLECTSQTIPYGFIGQSTDNRYGLMVTENGGALRKTTYYNADKNIQSTVAEVTVDATGNAKAKVVTSYSGLQYQNSGLSSVLNNTAEEQKKWIQENTQIPTFDVGQFSMTNKKDKVPTATVKMDLSLNKYASVSNKRIFLTPNLMNRSTFVPEKVENRKTPFVLSMGYTDIDTIKYHIPESMYPEFLPADSKFTSRFGTYESGFKLDQGSLIYIRKMTRKDGEYPAEAYQELIDFHKSVNKADNTKLVFLSKT
jgi:hypothetical protein